MKELPRKQIDSILQKQTFEPGQPGPILLNVQAMIEAIGQGIPTTSKYFVLPISCLADLNDRLTTPLAHSLKRPQLKSFPTIAGLFLLLRASGLAVSEAKPRRVVMIDPQTLGSWESLNPTEKYLSLVDVLFNRCNLSILGEGDFHGNYLRNEIIRMNSRLEHISMFIQGQRFTPLSTSTAKIAAALLEQLGWIKMEYTTEFEQGKTAEVQSIEKTEFGEVMFSLLCGIDAMLEFDGPSFVQDTLKPLIPQWQNNLSQPEPTFRPGRYTLKMSWGDVWRRLEVPATTTLHEVVYCLLDAFKFDDDHLYQFSYRDPSGKNVIVTDGRLDDGELFANEVSLGDLPLGEGESIQLWYDFGDDWKFSIVIESIDESVTKEFKPKITARKGKAPKQYDW